MKRLDQLTFTRFVAILLVLFYHDTATYYVSFVTSPSIWAILHSAPTAVSYLYVLSGFVMSLVYFRPEQKFDIGAYWRARFIRIYPLYIIAFLLTCYYYLDSLLRIKPQKILANIFVVQAWIPAYSQSFNYAAWSMTVEFFFYALFPFFVLWAYQRSTRGLIWLAIFLWAVSQAVSHILWMGFFTVQEGFIVYFPLFHLNSFIMGVVGGIWYLREGRQQLNKPITILLVLAAGVILTAAYTIVSTVYYPWFPHRLQPMSGLLAPFMVVIIISLALDKSRLSVLQNHPWLVNLGETAYAIYILHVPVAWLYERALESSMLTDPGNIFAITFLPLIVTIGLLSHFYIDLPLRSWLKKILKDISLPLLVLDLVIIAASIVISFRFRFGDGREYLSYQSMGRIMFWSAFLLRPLLSGLFRGFNPRILYGSISQFVRPLLISTTLGSAILFSIIFAGYSRGSFENFPRSIFIMDWAIVLIFSLLVRYLFRLAGFYSPRPLPASAA